ncbi:MAG TPA: type 4a pilus biogenesis protein PilO [Gaiellaceae bacterium]|jgi:Tfp pilus assembly protein PilO|nr:type 4a pilus biogenesis protein PilO [Gaiellaceae bacterium]
MTARLSALSRPAQLALVGTALLLVVVVGWFALVAPKRSTAADLKEQTAAVQAQIDRNRSSAFARALPAVRSASVFRLAKAMPDAVGMPDVMLELNQLATDSGISFDEITPQMPAADTAFDVEPITMQFTGNFYNLSDFLLRLRNLVRVENGKLLANGRMFAVSGLSFAEAEQKFPVVTATMTVNAFVPAAPQPVAPVATDTAAGATTTTGTTTTPAPAAAPGTGSTGGQS